MSIMHGCKSRQNLSHVAADDKFYIHHTFDVLSFPQMDVKFALYYLLEFSSNR